MDKKEGKKPIFDISQPSISGPEHRAKRKAPNIPENIYDTDKIRESALEYQAARELEKFKINLQKSKQDNFNKPRDQKPDPNSDSNLKMAERDLKLVDFVSTLAYLELSEVEDKDSSINFLGKEYREIVDLNLIELFHNHFGDIEGMNHCSRKFIYIGKEGKIYRRPYEKQVKTQKSTKENVIKKSVLQDEVNDIATLLENEHLEDNEDMNSDSNLGACSRPSETGTKPKVLSPPKGWKSNIYSSIMSGKRNQSDYEQDSEEEFTWVENPQKGKKTVKTFKHARKIPAENKTKLNVLSLNELNRMEEEVSALKTEEFNKLKDLYESSYLTFQVSMNQFNISSKNIDEEMEKPRREQNQALISSHLSLKTTLENQKVRLQKLEKQLRELVQRKSPYLLNEIKMPKFGQKDFFDHEKIKLFPIVTNDDDISIKALFEMISEWGQNENLSEKGFKHAIFSRLRGKRLKAWLDYKDQPLKEAITNLILLFDKHDSPLKYATDIKNFRKLDGEDIQNSTQRLLLAINKHLEYVKDNHERQIIRKELLKDKLDKLLSPRAFREVFKMMEKKNQLGEDLSEKELLSAIYTENMFDQRSQADRSYVQVSNVNLRETNDDNTFENEDGLECSAIEHKRRSDGSFANRFPEKANETSDRKILSAKRSFPQSGNLANNSTKPIVIGRNNTPYVMVKNPNPMNRYHPRQRNQSSYPAINSGPTTTGYERVKDFIHSRNAPLIPGSNQARERQSYNQPDLSEHRQYYPNNYRFDARQQRNPNRNYFAPNQRNNSLYRFPNRNNYGYRQNNFSNGLRHNLQVKTNPPAIFQQISMDELNAICINCPEESEKHKVSDCPQLEGQVFRKAPSQTLNT